MHMLHKEALDNVLSRSADQSLETTLCIFPPSSDLLDGYLTPTSLSFMSEANEQTYGSLPCSRMADSSDEETGDDSSESFEARGVEVPGTAAYSGGPSGQQQQSSGGGGRKVKSLKRKLPGPRPAFSDDELTEEEMQRRMRRRERNKMAAARCRQRRVDQTNELLHETKNLESEAGRLEKEIESLEKLKTKLEIVLQSHIPLCTANVPDRRVPSASGSFQAPPAPSPPLYLTSNPQASLVLVTLPSNPSLPGSQPARPSTLVVSGASGGHAASNQHQTSNGSLFDFDLPPVSSSPLNSVGDLHFSSADFLTPTTLEQRLFD